MKSKRVLFSEFMEEQRVKHQIPDYGALKMVDILHLIAVYSDMDHAFPVQTNYYVSMYYIARYLTREFSEDTGVWVFETDDEEKKQFEEAYRVYAQGRDYLNASYMMGQLVQKNHLDAIEFYMNIQNYRTEKGFADNTYYQEKLKELHDPVTLMDLPGILAMCFEQNTRALTFLAHILDENYNISNSTGVHKDNELAKILLNWLLIIYANRIAKNPEDGYSMMAVRGDVYSISQLKDEKFCQYWLEQALNIRYAPAEMQKVTEIELEINANFGSADYELIDQGIAYAKDIDSCGIASGKEHVKILKKDKKLERQYESNLYTQKTSSAQYEKQMLEYREKLDNREIMLNFLTQGTPWTNQDDQLYGWLTKDYDRYSMGVLTDSARQIREHDYLKKLMKASESEAYANRIKREEEKNQRKEENWNRQRELEKLKPVEGRTIVDYTHVMMPPVESELLENKEFEQMYRECNAYRQMEDFPEARKIAEEMMEKWPESHMAHWMHLLAVHGIVFRGGFDLFYIELLSDDWYSGFYKDADYKWMSKYAPKEASAIYGRYISMFSNICKRYLKAGKSKQNTDVVICYRKLDDDGNETSASLIVRSLLQKDWGSIQVYSEASRFSGRDRVYKEAFTYPALKNAKLFVLIANTEQDLLTPSVMNQWTRYCEWAKEYKSGRRILAVSSGALNEYYEVLADDIYIQENTRDTEELFQKIKGIFNGPQYLANWMAENKEITTMGMNIFSMGRFLAMQERNSFKNSNSQFRKVVTNEMQDQSDFLGPEDGMGIINMRTATYVSIISFLKTPVSFHQQIRLNLQVYNTEGLRITWLYFDFDVNSGNDRYFVRWDFRHDTGDYVVTSGVYRARVWIDEDDYADCFFGLMDPGEAPSEKDKLFDQIIRHFSIKLTSEEKKQPEERQDMILRAKADVYYQSMLEERRRKRHKKDKLVEHKKKGLFKKALVRDVKSVHEAVIQEDGTVKVTSSGCQYAYGDQNIENEIRSLRNIVQVSCLASGIVTLDAEGKLSYIGINMELKAQLRGITNVIEIEHGYDSVYILTSDHRVTEVSETGRKDCGQKNVYGLFCTSEYQPEGFDMDMIAYFEEDDEINGCKNLMEYEKYDL